MADDLKAIWQNQRTETSKMTMLLIRGKARELRAKTRRELFGNISAAAIVVAISVAGIMRGQWAALRVIFAWAMIWSLVGQYFLHRGMWSERLAGDAGLSTGLDFCRRELQRRRDHFRRALQWAVGPVMLALGGMIVWLAGMAKSQGVAVGRIMPFSVLAVVWVVALFILRVRNRRELQREIDELNEIERETGR